MFIYVMDVSGKDKLLSLGYKLLKENKKKTVWVFENKQNTQFESIDVFCVVSDVLTF